MKKSLIYIPNGLNSPEIEILLCQAQKEIDEKKDVHILICNGGKNFHCSKNINSLKLICFACKNKRKDYLTKLKGKFNIIKTPPIFKKNVLSNKKISISKLFNYHYQKSDNGLSAYSRYVELTRDRDLDGNIAFKTINQLINTSNQLTSFFFKLLNKERFDDIYLFNGRNNNYRPLLRVGCKHKVHNLEFKLMKIKFLTLKIIYR